MPGCFFRSFFKGVGAMSSFYDFKLLSSLLATLKEKEFKTPTEIQTKAIPTLLEGRSLVGIAETGSGKTLSYALPLLHHVKNYETQEAAISVSGQPRAVVVVPTRELGEQVAKVFKIFTHQTRLRVRTLLGGTALDVAKRNVAGPLEILVATPGRLVQLMDRSLVKLGDTRILVFDEADQMLDQGFINDAHRIVKETRPDRQMVLFSATISSSVEKLIQSLFSDAQVIRSQGSRKTVPTLITENKLIKDGRRFPILEKILAQEVEGGTIIFTNTREQCDKLADELSEAGMSCTIYRGEMDKVERRSNLRAFREGRVSLLISTDLASRGLDVEHVGRVINYHLPQQIENYIHRVGRTARAGRKGLVINFVTERDRPLMDEVKKL
jgi:superfamily II DNA/RNA helicase